MIFIISFIFLGCWNYRETGDLWMVAGAAIDWDNEDNKYVLTTEIVKPSGGKEIQMISQTISIKSDTLFDTMRKAISVSGRRLYWAHTSILIVSDPIARRGLVPILDLLSRGGEFRSNIWIAVSRENTAKELLETKLKLYDATSLQLAEILKAQKNSSNFLNSEAWYFNKDFADEGISPVLSTIKMVKSNGEFTPQIYGAAIFKKDKLIGYIDEMDTKGLLFVRNDLKGGVIVVKNVANTTMNVSLEILKSKTTITPQIQDENISMTINVKTYVAISEMEGSINLLSNEGLINLKNDANKTIKAQIKKIIDKAQNDFDSDVLGFGKKIQKKAPNTWKKLEPNWDETFKSLKTNVNVDVSIISSSTSYTPVTVGD